VHWTFLLADLALSILFSCVFCWQNWFFLLDLLLLFNIMSLSLFLLRTVSLRLLFSYSAALPPPFQNFA
jgi:hypothetical protein